MKKKRKKDAPLDQRCKNKRSKEVGGKQCTDHLQKRKFLASYWIEKQQKKVTRLFEAVYYLHDRRTRKRGDFALRAIERHFEMKIALYGEEKIKVCKKRRKKGNVQLQLQPLFFTLSRQ